MQLAQYLHNKATPSGPVDIILSLRTYAQKTNAHFIFTGSHKHLLRPFYQSVTIINLKPLSLDKYIEFATSKFEDYGKTLDSSVVETLYKRYDGITSYIHRILNVLFSRTEKGQICTSDMIVSAEDFIIHLSSDTYESLFYQMPTKQRIVFLAIASEGKVTEVMGSDFIRRHSLASASSVSSALKGLLDKDFITKDAAAYYVHDKFFVLWLRSRNMI